jgi:putative nucleotidyltransferase with HDIG domain
MESWTQSDALRKHMLAVEAAVAAYARTFRTDEELWRVAAILHDFDYEKHPHIGEDGHPFVGVRYLREQGYPEEVLTAILGHADFSSVPRESLLAKTLYACDEITGLITAAVLVRPDKDIANLEVRSLKKKFKDKVFARGVKREDVVRGATELGVELWEHVGFVLKAMQDEAEALGLDGRLAR